MATLAELRTQTALWLDDPKFTRFTPALLNDLLNLAYPMVVGIVENQGKLWNVAGSYLLLIVTADAREYVVRDMRLTEAQSDGSEVRRVIELRRHPSSAPVDPGEFTVPTALGERVPFTVFTELDDASLGYPTLKGIPSDGVYLYRRVNPTAAAWVIGFAAEQPAPQDLLVQYVPEPLPLTADNDQPHMVPRGYHHLVAMRAAIIGKGTEERTHSTLAAEYAEQVRLMVGELSSPVAHRSRRF